MSTPGSSSGHEHGIGKTGGLPGANADPSAAETTADEVAELQAGEVAPDAGQRDA